MFGEQGLSGDLCGLYPLPKCGQLSKCNSKLNKKEMKKFFSTNQQINKSTNQQINKFLLKV